MRFNVFIVPALAAMVAAHPTEVSTGGDLVARDEYRWCLGTRSCIHTIRESATDISNRREDQHGQPEEIQLAYARHRHQQGLPERRTFPWHQRLPVA